MIVHHIDGELLPVPCKCKDCNAFEHCMGGKAIIEAEILRKQMMETGDDQCDPDEVENIAWERMDANVSAGASYVVSLLVAGYTVLKRLIGKFTQPNKEKAK